VAVGRRVALLSQKYLPFTGEPRRFASSSQPDRAPADGEDYLIHLNIKSSHRVTRHVERNVIRRLVRYYTSRRDKTDTYMYGFTRSNEDGRRHLL